MSPPEHLLDDLQFREDQTIIGDEKKLTFGEKHRDRSLLKLQIVSDTFRKLQQQYREQGKPHDDAFFESLYVYASTYNDAAVGQERFDRIWHAENVRRLVWPDEDANGVSAQAKAMVERHKKSEQAISRARNDLVTAALPYIEECIEYGNSKAKLWTPKREKIRAPSFHEESKPIPSIGLLDACRKFAADELALLHAILILPDMKKIYRPLYEKLIKRREYLNHEIQKYNEDRQELELKTIMRDFEERKSGEPTKMLG